MAARAAAGGASPRASGIAVLHKAPAMPPNTASSALIRFNEDATANVMVSGVDYGQGTATSLSQIAAHALGLPLEKIHFVWGKDTDFSPYDWQTVASRLTVMGGLCIQRAADGRPQSDEGGGGPGAGGRARAIWRSAAAASSSRAIRPRACATRTWCWATNSPTATPSAAR